MVKCHSYDAAGRDYPEDSIEIDIPSETTHFEYIENGLQRITDRTFENLPNLGTAFNKKIFCFTF